MKRTAMASDVRLRLLDLLVENAHDYAIFTLSTKGNISSWNPGAERILGYSEAEALEMNIAVIFPPEARSSGVPEQEMQTALREGRAEDECWHLKKDGSRFFASGMMTLLVNASGEVEGFAKILRDITESKHAEEALQNSEVRLHSIANLVPDLLWDSEPDGSTNWYNQRWMEYTGQSFEEAIGWGWMNAIHPDDREASAQRYREAVDERKMLHREHRIRRYDGEYRWFVVNAFPLKDESGKVIKMYGAATDIHEARLMQEALRLSEEQYRLTVENIRDYVIFTLDTEGRVTSWSEGARRVKGYEHEEILGQHFRVFYTPEDQDAGKPEREMQHAAETGRSEDESWRVRKDGTRFWGDEITSSIRDETGVLRGFVKINRDLTERKQSEEERLQWEHETTLLAERNRMAQELHDTLAQSFTGIKLQTELGEDFVETDPAKAKKHLVRIREIAVGAMAEARNAIRALRLPLLQDGTLAEALERLAEHASDQIKVEFWQEGEVLALPSEMENDIYRIAQEAVTNALSYSQAQQLTLHLIYSSAAVRLTVSDDGKGFDTTLPRRGFGVKGMHERAARWGAELSLVSEAGQGTQLTLFVRIP